MVRAHSLIAGPLNPDEDYPVPSQFGGSDFLPGDDLEEIVQALIGHYRDFTFLEEFTVRAVWKAKGGSFQGKAVLGKCVKPTGLAKFYAQADFVVWLAADAVKDYQLSRWQVEAALYHELKHATCEEDEEGEKTPAYRGHDVEAFNDEVSEYGAWKNELKATAKVMLQLELDLSDPSPAEKATAQTVVDALVDQVAERGDEIFADSLAHGDIERISVTAGGKKATVRRPATVQN